MSHLLSNDTILSIPRGPKLVRTASATATRPNKHRSQQTRVSRTFSSHDIRIANFGRLFLVLKCPGNRRRRISSWCRHFCCHILSEQEKNNADQSSSDAPLRIPVSKTLMFYLHVSSHLKRHFEWKIRDKGRC